MKLMDIFEKAKKYEELKIRINADSEYESMERTIAEQMVNYYTSASNSSPTQYNLEQLAFWRARFNHHDLALMNNDRLKSYL